MQDVYFAYDEGTASEVRALKGVSLSFDRGEFVAIVGKNGSGKSTLARIINGLSLPTSGQVTVDGKSTAIDDNLFDIRKTVGVVFQNPDNQMVATIIEDDIAFGPENLGLPPKEIRERVDWALRSVGMYEHREGTPFRLSGGQKQRIAIAGVLALRPQVMILDESTAMLDPVGRREVMDVIMKLNREEGMTVIMITHFMEEAAMADRIIVMNDGTVYADGGKEIFEDTDGLHSVGLDAPTAVKVAHAIGGSGYDMGRVYDIESLVDEICRLKSKT